MTPIGFGMLFKPTDFMFSGYRRQFGCVRVLQSSNVVAEAMAVSLDKPSGWAVGFFFGNTERSLELWNIISGISGFDD